MRSLTGYVIILLLISTQAHARTPVAIHRCDAPPVVDGRLDEACWTAAATLDDFVQIKPGDNAPPSRGTVVRLGYDAQALYIGIRAEDDATKVRATVARRDDILDDDHVILYLDTFDDRRRAYVLAFNPLGIQQDGIYTEGREIDYSADLVLHSKGIVDASGYTIEAALPFSSIRHRSGADRRWGVHVERRIRHLDEETSWMPRTRGNANLLAQAGTITGIERLDARRMIEAIPGLTVAEHGARVRALGRFRTEPIDMEPSVTMKLGLASDVVLDATVNPDFAQIESDQLVSSANQRFPIFFEEKRPFFLEGIDVFQTPLNAMHSRTIGDPDYAAKASGKSGRNTFALLLASDNAPGALTDEELIDPANFRIAGHNARSGVLRVRRDIGAESYLGAIATSYDFVDRENRVAGVDGRITLDKNTVVTFQLLGTFSEHEKRGLGFFAEWRRSGRHLNIIVSGEGRTPDYRADLGFTTQTDTNRWSVVTRYDSEPRPEARLISWTFTNTFFSQWDWAGNAKYVYVYPRVTFNFRRQTEATIFLYCDYLRLFEEEFGTEFFGEPERSTVFKGVSFSLQTKPSKLVTFALSAGHDWDNFDFDFGAPPKYPRVSPAALADPNALLDPGTGRSFGGTGRVEVQPMDSLRVSLEHTRNRFVRNDTGRVAFDERLFSGQATYYFTPSAFTRARVDYDSLHSNVRGQFLLGWSPSPGTSLYAGYTDDMTRNGFNPFTGRPEPGMHRNSRTVFVKMSYLVRRAW